MGHGGRRLGAGRKRRSAPQKEKPRPRKPKPHLFAVVDGGSGVPPEPDWTMLFSDELDVALAHEHWGLLIRELREGDKLSTANAHQIKRATLSYVFYDKAAQRVAEDGAVFPKKGRRGPKVNPWFGAMKDSNAMASAIEAELTITPRRRNNGGKIQKRSQTTRPADAFLKPVAR